MDLCWIAEEEGQVLAKWQILDFVIRVAGVDIRAGGVQAVVAEPSQRGRGPALGIVPATYAEVVADGFDIVFGFAQRGAFYERLGGAVVMANYTLRVERRRIPRLRTDPFSTLVPHTESDVERVFDYYGRSNAERTGSMVRTVKHWGWMPRRPTNILIAPDGYVGYRMQPDAVEIREIAGDTVEFYDTALRRLGAIAEAAGVDEVRGPVPIDHPFAEVCASYGSNVKVEYPAHSGGMAMIVNVESFVRKLAPAFERRLAESRFRDTHVQFSLRCDDAELMVDLNPSGPNERKLELALSRSALLRLAFGYLSVETVLATESIASRSLGDDGLRVLEVLFPKGHPFMWEPDRF